MKIFKKIINSLIVNIPQVCDDSELSYNDIKLYCTVYIQTVILQYIIPYY